MESAMLSNVDVPDIFEIEIGQAGALFRGPIKDIGLVDLTSRVMDPNGPDGKGSLWSRVVNSKFAAYTDRGHIFGLPHDVHPMMLSYRRDIFKKYGVDPSKLKTWDDFIAAGHKMTIPGKQYMIELDEADDDMFMPFLYQRGGGYFDANGNVIMDNEAAIQTMLFYAPLVEGKHKIANNVGGMFNNAENQAIENGFLLCYIQPDWRCNYFEVHVPQVGGKMALMPLPMISNAPPSKANPPCSTWGGTMIAMTKASKHQDLAWQLMMYFYLDRVGAEERYEQTEIIPPVRDLWNIPGISDKGPMTPETAEFIKTHNAYWSGQRVGQQFISVANYVPPHYSSSTIQVADTKMSLAVAECDRYYGDHYRENAPDHGEGGFEAFVRKTFKFNADQVRKFVKRSEF
jgi:arabinosaccharide transport system substrate-binding protein